MLERFVSGRKEICRELREGRERNKRHV